MESPFFFILLLEISDKEVILTKSWDLSSVVRAGDS